MTKKLDVNYSLKFSQLDIVKLTLTPFRFKIQIVFKSMNKLSGVQGLTLQNIIETNKIRSTINLQTINIYFHSNKNEFEEEVIMRLLSEIFLIRIFLQNIKKIVEVKYKNSLEKFSTIAELSLSLFKLFYNYKKIPLKISNCEEIFIRPAFFGGRCEIFGNQRENEYVKYFDFRGMYGQCMMENFHNGKGRFLLDADINQIGFHSIEYETKDNYLPILPYRGPFDKRVTFSNSIEKRTGIFWFEEIKLFLQEGGKIHKIIMSLVYDKYEKVFDSFVNEFSQYRREGEVANLLGKSLVNSLFGRLGINTNENETILTFDENEYLWFLQNTNVIADYSCNSIYVINIKRDYKYFNHFKTNKLKKKLTEKNVSYAAATAAKARIKLFRALKSVINDGGRPVYCDTDSIFAAYPLINKKTYFCDQNNDALFWLKNYEDSLFMNTRNYILKNSDLEIRKGSSIYLQSSFSELKKKFYSPNNTFEKYNKRKWSENKDATFPLVL